jgi:hypothetical protein
MSAAHPIDPEGFSPEVKQGALAGLLGLLGMVARIVISPEPVGWIWVTKRLVAATITAAFAGLALESYVSNPQLRYALTGLSGYMAPEVLQWAEDMARAKLKGSLDKAKKEAGLKPAKPNGKRKTKRNRGA